MQQRSNRLTLRRRDRPPGDQSHICPIVGTARTVSTAQSPLLGNPIHGDCERTRSDAGRRPLMVTHDLGPGGRDTSGDVVGRISGRVRRGVIVEDGNR